MDECAVIVCWSDDSGTALIFEDKSYRDAPEWVVWAMSALKGAGSQDTRSNMFWRRVEQLEMSGLLSATYDYDDIQEDIVEDVGGLDKYLYIDDEFGARNVYINEWIHTDLTMLND